MFEFSVIRKYLIPRKRHLSVALIGLMSVFVISSVVWLILVFLSVTSGIEKNWLKKLTSLNSPVRIVPTQEYYSSYYYLIDHYAEDSDYSAKTIREKRFSQMDPYDPESDLPLPRNFPKNQNIDLVKQAFLQIEKVQSKHPSLSAEDYEVGTGLLKLKLLHEDIGLEGNFLSQNFLTQASYVTTFVGSNPNLSKLISPPTIDDLNHILQRQTLLIENVLSDDELTYSKSEGALKAFFDHVDIKQILPKSNHIRNPQGFTKNVAFPCYIQKQRAKYNIILSEEGKQSVVFSETGIVVLEKHNRELPYSNIDVYLSGINTLQYVGLSEKHQIQAKTKLKDKELTLSFAPEEIRIIEAAPKVQFEEKPQIEPLWAYHLGNTTILPQLNGELYGVLLPKNYIENGVKIADVGYLSYGSFTSSRTQEQRLGVQVLGFYDPGILSVGARCILAPYELTHTLATTAKSNSLDPFLSNGIQVWYPSIDETKTLVNQLKAAFTEAGIDQYFAIHPFYEFSFAKDLMQQFQSDKYLFSLVGIIILFVACSNIIALLLILIKDKKKEIGIMLAMGASKRSMAIIFGGLGATLGAISSLIGTLLAYLTLKNINVIAKGLSFIQGREAFNPAFYGSHLPTEISFEALKFLFIATPILALLASLIPAWFAMRLSPTDILRSE